MSTILFTAALLKEQAMSRKQYSLSKQLVVATALALGTSGVALADDNGMNPFTGDSYAYFNGGQNLPYGKPAFNNAPSSFRKSNPHGLSEREYEALASDGKPRALPDPSTAATAVASFHQTNPHGLSFREYQALASADPVWLSPQSGTSAPASTYERAVAKSAVNAPSGTGIAGLFGFLRANRATSAN
jgi:hypothetical protein